MIYNPRTPLKTFKKAKDNNDWDAFIALAFFWICFYIAIYYS